MSVKPVTVFDGGTIHKPLVVSDGTSQVTVRKDGIVFPDNTVQTTASTGGSGSYPVTSVAGKTGAVTLNINDINGLSSTYLTQVSAGNTYLSLYFLVSLIKYKNLKEVLYTWLSLIFMVIKSSSVNNFGSLSNTIWVNFIISQFFNIRR